VHTSWYYRVTVLNAEDFLCDGEFEAKDVDRSFEYAFQEARANISISLSARSFRTSGGEQTFGKREFDYRKQKHSLNNLGSVF
jgi:hypothetical protein